MSRSRLVQEEEASLISDGYVESDLDARAIRALRVADAMVVDPQSLDTAIRQELLDEFGAGGIVELSIAVGFFMAGSKLLIAFGLEPDEMQTKVVEAPVVASTIV